MGSKEEKYTHIHLIHPEVGLIYREWIKERKEKPSMAFGSTAKPRTGEDYFRINTDFQRVRGIPMTSFSVFGIFDGHNGRSVALFSRDHLLDNVLSAIPHGIGREEWLRALPRALVAGFVKTDKDFQRLGVNSGTTATFVIVNGWTVTVASVGDSRCILDAQGCVSVLTADHRLDEEVDRVRASRGLVRRVTYYDGFEVGPMRCWPGGLCLSRSIGDMDVGEFIVLIPHVKQVKLSPSGGRLIVASDGIWDADRTE